MATDDVEMNLHGEQKDISWIFDQYVGPTGEIPVSKFEDIVEEYRKSLSEATIRKLLNYADKNKDGYITKQELLRLENEDVEVVAKATGVAASDLTTFKRGVKFAGDMVLTNQHDKELYYKKYTCLPPPLFMILISVIELAVYIYYGVTLGEWMTYHPELLNSPLIFDPRKRQEVWRFLTYMLLHAGLEHILFNLLIQLLLGIPLEMVHGGLRVGAIYLTGVIGGSLASSIFDPYTPLVGASGGVYSLFTAQLANVVLNGDVMHKLSSLLRTIFVVFILCADFGYSIYRRFETTASGTKVSFVAHVAGAIAGLTMGLMVLHNFKKSLRDKIVFWIAVGVFSAFMLFAIFWNIFWPYYPTM
uniref:rhomboid protease n=1 Tax=Ciona intestinalis TaxID=7719 RepID=H2XJX5_CIOIN|nr:rhomboid-related protein 2 [Ciona intestinalis]|eukprot:XP_002130870.1 rhomboid-related protein 2 [Ciona intestinalis]